MTQHKTITIPFIDGLESLSKEEFLSKMGASAAAGKVDTINWPEAFPYCPECSFRIARSKEYLALSFDVEGRDLRATELTDNGRNWEDSCCEVFVSPEPGRYYNIEINCIGSVLMAFGEGRNGRIKVDPGQVARIIRHCSLEHKCYCIEGENVRWQVAVLIPFDIIGLDPENLPEGIRGNFYKCGDLTATPHFVTWSPVGTEKPDFHRPEYFGEFKFKI